MICIIVDIYVRVSTLEQAEEGYSIMEQEDRLRKYAAAQGWRINRVCTDAGLSGGSLDRPGIQEVISDAKNGRINKVIVYKLDRLSRSQKDTLYLIEDVFLQNGVDFVSMTESLDTSTPFGLAIIGILSVFAQLERQQIKERMMLGRDARVRTGKYHGNSNQVIGYDYDCETSTLTQNPYDAMVVLEIFNRYVRGESEASIARLMNERQWRGHNWTAAKINRTLNQPLYVGRQRWRGEEFIVEGCPSIVPEYLWNAVRREKARKGRTAKNPQTSGQHVTLLGGLLWCGCCGARYNGVKSTENGKTPIYRYYCYNRVFKRHHLPHKECDNRGWRDSTLDGIVLDEIRKLKTSKPIFDPAEKEKENSSVEALESSIKKLEEQKDRLIDLYAVGTFSADQLNKKAAAIDTQIEGIRKKIKEIQHPSGRLDDAELKKAISTFEELISASELDKKALYTVVHQLVQSVTLTGDEVKIQWNFET